MRKPVTTTDLMLHSVWLAVLIVGLWVINLKHTSNVVRKFHLTGDSLTQEDPPTEPSKLESAELRNLVEQTNADNRELIYQWFQMHTRLEEVENELEGLGQGNERADRPDRKVRDSGN